jgi:ATP-binding cassette, subfamily B, bacterial PglK
LKSYLKEILFLLGNDRLKLTNLLLLFILTSILDVIGIGVIGPYIAIVVDEEFTINSFFSALNYELNHDESVYYLGLLLIIVFIIKTVLSIWVNYKIVKFGTNQQARLRYILINSYLSLPYTVFLERNRSEYTHAIQNLVGHYSDGVVMPLLRMLSNGIIALFVISYLAYSNPEILLILISSLLFMVGSYHLFFRKTINKKGRLLNRSAIDIVKILNESIDGFKEVRVLGVDNNFKESLKNKAIEYGKLYSHVKAVSLAPRYLIELVMILFIVFLTMGVGSGEMNSQELIVIISTFGLAAIRLLPTAAIFSQGLSQLSFNRNSVSLLAGDVLKINDLEMLKNKRHSVKGGVPEIFKELALDNITFSYGNSNKVIDNLSLRISSGEVIGFIGGSGSGKTTLIDVILGLLKPDSGRVIVNNRVLIDENVKEWQANIAYLPQQIFLIDDTLTRNIALGIPDGEIDKEKILSSLKKARLLDFVERLNYGVNTIIGERGAKLSGGQRQRVALARAFYHERNVLIMDESTSALDSETEKEVIREVNYLKGKMTIIMIAHRHSTLQGCDRVFKLKNGKIEISGHPRGVLKS